MILIYKIENIYCTECNSLKISATKEYHYRLENDEENQQITKDYLSRMEQYRKNNYNDIIKNVNLINTTKKIQILLVVPNVAVQQ